jgi:hypothetical protein
MASPEFKKEPIWPIAESHRSVGPVLPDPTHRPRGPGVRLRKLQPKKLGLPSNSVLRALHGATRQFQNESISDCNWTKTADVKTNYAYLQEAGTRSLIALVLSHNFPPAWAALRASHCVSRSGVRSLPITHAIANYSGLGTDAPHAVTVGKGHNLYSASLSLAAFDRSRRARSATK